jgi:Fe-S cluster assembly protein SufD
MITQLATSLYDQCLAAYEVRSSLQSGQEPDTLTALRNRAIERFKKLGFPSTRHEEWKYTNLAPYLREEYFMEQEEDMINLDEETWKQQRIAGLDAYTLVTINGKLSAALSDHIPAREAVVCSLQDAFNEAGFKAHFGKHLQMENQSLAALNTALFRDGIYIEVKAGGRLSRPIHIIHVRTSPGSLLIHPRQLFILGKHAEACILESYFTVADSMPVFANEASEIVLAENSNLTHYCLQQGDDSSRQVQHMEVYQEASSVYSQYKASFPGAALLRNTTHVILDGKNIESHLYGIYLCGGKQVADNHTLVDHRMPHCQSNELYKGVMMDESSGIFNGKIFVRQDAQKTNAFQQNNNLMLSEKAVVDSKPQLEIFADDVKCSHGSTVGQFNEQAIFYLQSRGIGLETARSLLVQAFLFDVTDKMPHEPVRDFINKLVAVGLKQE